MKKIIKTMKIQILIIAVVHIHEVEMKQFQLFWMVEMVEINFNFLIKF